ncbi:hypothetical protein ABZ897_25325 [Nonomuraea sp. NPDC046802]|uniref:hypothetical protein n=1 Tax=Nonomuraea sp. NPDC046802 TaxID=3154919 RepID=UPI0033F42BFF
MIARRRAAGLLRWFVGAWRPAAEPLKSPAAGALWPLVVAVSGVVGVLWPSVVAVSGVVGVLCLSVVAV